MIKHAASLVTAARIIGTFALLLTKPLSVLFFVIYGLCCASDILDGYIARKTNTASKLGEMLDSIADFVLVAVLLVVLFLLYEWEWWMIYWMGTIALTRFSTLGIGFVKYHAMSFLHTYANKATGIALACFPVLFLLFGIPVTAFVLCVVASLSALEELIITICSRSLNSNIKSVLKLGHK